MDYDVVLWALLGVLAKRQSRIHTVSALREQSREPDTTRGSVRVRFALQGKVLTRELTYGGAYVLLTLEPPMHHRPSYGARYVERLYKPVSFDEQHRAWTCVGCGEWWR